MRIVKIIMQIAVLYIIFMAGTWIQKTFQLFIPGSIIGMLLLFLLLLMGAFKQEWIETGSLFLIKYLPLLFVPVTVGIISFLDVFTGKGMLIILIVLMSTVIVMVCTGLVSQWLVVKKEQGNE